MTGRTNAFADEAGRRDVMKLAGIGAISALTVAAGPTYAQVAPRTTLRELNGFDQTPASLSNATLILVDYQNTYTRGVMELDGWEPALKSAAQLLSNARAAGMASGVSMASRINCGCPRPCQMRRPFMPYPSRWIPFSNYVPMQPAGFGGPSTADRRGRIFGRCPYNSGKGIFCPCAPSTPACVEKATAPLPRCCSDSGARKRIGKSTRARTRRAASSPTALG